MAEPLATRLVPSLLCSARLYSEQISPPPWRFVPVMVVDHRHDVSRWRQLRGVLTFAPS